MAPMGAIWLFSVLTYIALSHYFMAPISPTLHPDRSACGIGYASKNILNGKQFNWLSIEQLVYR